MVSFFQKVPRELRDQIYRELLVDNVHSVDPKLRLDNTTVKKQLCPAILRTCKQAYAEALAVLYEENVFRFNWYLLAECSYDILAEYNLSKARLDRIKKVRSPYPQIVIAKRVGYQLEIVYRGEARAMSDDEIISVIDEILEVFNLVRSLRCSLKTLHIYFDFDFWNSDEDEDCGDLLKDNAELIAMDEDIYKAVADLEIGKRIEITVHSRYEEVCRSFGTFASKLGSRKRWTVTLLPMKRAVSEDRLNSVNQDDEENNYREDPTVEDGFLDPGIFKQAETYEVDIIPDDVGSNKETISEDEHLRGNGSFRYIWTWILTPKITASE